jgi:hypothetical protein
MASTKKSKTAKLTGNGGGPDKPNGRHWTQWIEPRGAALLSEMLGPIYFVIKNHGPDGVMLVAAHGDLMDLPAGKVRATYAHGTIRVENKGEKSALIEFDFLPIFKR